MQDNLTFESLPRAVAVLTEEVSELKSLLIEREKQKEQSKIEKLMSVKDAANFLGLAVATIYSKVSRGELPVMKRAGRLYFSNSELLEYVQEGRVRTIVEIEADSHEFLAEKKGGAK